MVLDNKDISELNVQIKKKKKKANDKKFEKGNKNRKAYIT